MTAADLRRLGDEKFMDGLISLKESCGARRAAGQRDLAADIEAGLALIVEAANRRIAERNRAA